MLGSLTSDTTEGVYVDATAAVRMGTPVFAPKWPALGTALAGLVAVACAVFAWKASDPTVVAIVGYVVGCIVAVALASAHRAMEQRQRPNPQFRLQPWLGRVATLGMVLGIVGGLASAVFLAMELAK